MMNHDEIQALLAAYADDELPGSVRRLVEAHAAGCAECRADLAALTALQRQLGKTFQARAALLEAPAGGWAALQGRIAAEPAPLRHAPGSGNHSRSAAVDEPPRQGRALRVFSLGFALLAVLVFTWLVIVSPLIGGQSAAPGEKRRTPTPEPARPTPTAIPPAHVEQLTPLSPTRLPEGLAYMDDSTLPGGARQTTFYNKHNDRFLVVTQHDLAHAVPPPADGQTAAVGSLPAVTKGGLSGQVTVDGRAIKYTGATSLTWQTPFGTQVSILSNLPADKISTFAESMAVTFTHFDSTGLPQGRDDWSTKGQDAVDGGLLISEVHEYSEKHFVILTEQADIPQAGAASTPAGEPITLSGGIKASITRGLSGTAPAQADTFFGGRSLTVLGGGGGGGGGGGPDYTPPVYPDTIDYTAGIRLDWSQGGTRLDVLTNLAEADALAYAAAMQPSPADEGALVTGAFVDTSILPQGGALMGYVVNAPQLPAEFYGQTTVTVTGGQGEIVESRYFGNDHFVIIQTSPDDGSPLPQGDAVTIGGQNGVVQAQQKGTALLKIPDGVWATTLQDGVPRLFLRVSSGLVGTKDPAATGQSWPETLAYQSAVRLTWSLDGARLSLLTNLDQAQALDIAGKLTIVSKEFTVVNPVNQTEFGPVAADGFDVWSPTYLPAALDNLTPFDPTTNDGTTRPDLLFWDSADPSQFVALHERAARPNEFILTPFNSTLLGSPWLLEKVSGSYVSPYSANPHTIQYKDAPQITVIVDGTWIQLLTSLSQDEALKIARSMVKGK